MRTLIGKLHSIFKNRVWKDGLPDDSYTYHPEDDDALEPVRQIPDISISTDRKGVFIIFQNNFRLFLQFDYVYGTWRYFLTFSSSASFDDIRTLKWIETPMDHPGDSSFLELVDEIKNIDACIWNEVTNIKLCLIRDYVLTFPDSDPEVADDECSFICGRITMWISYDNAQNVYKCTIRPLGNRSSLVSSLREFETVVEMIQQLYSIFTTREWQGLPPPPLYPKIECRVNILDYVNYDSDADEDVMADYSRVARELQRLYIPDTQMVLAENGLRMTYSNSLMILIQLENTGRTYSVKFHLKIHESSGWMRTQLNPSGDEYYDDLITSLASQLRILGSLHWRND